MYRVTSFLPEGKSTLLRQRPIEGILIYPPAASVSWQQRSRVNKIVRRCSSTHISATRRSTNRIRPWRPFHPPSPQTDSLLPSNIVLNTPVCILCLCSVLIGASMALRAKNNVSYRCFYRAPTFVAITPLTDQSIAFLSPAAASIRPISSHFAASNTELPIIVAVANRYRVKPPTREV